MTDIKSKYAGVGERFTRNFASTLTSKSRSDLDALDAAMLDLMLDRPFYAGLLVTAGVVKIASGTAGVDDKNNLFICDAWFATQEAPWRITILAHEALHVGMAHHARMGDRDPYWCNIAMDCAINELLLQDGFVAVPDWCHLTGIGPKLNLTPQEIADLKDASWEEIYWRLTKDLPTETKPGKGKGQPGKGDGGQGQGKPQDGDEGEAGQGKGTASKPAQDDAEGNGDDAGAGGDETGDEDEGEAEGEGPGQAGDEAGDTSQEVAQPTAGTREGGHSAPGKAGDLGQPWGQVTPMTGEDGDEPSQAEIDAAIAEGNVKMEQALAAAIIHGKASDALRGAVKNNAQPQEDWKTLLRNWIVKATEVRSYTYSRMPRRLSTFRMPVALKEGCGRLIVLIDKSGSIGEAATMTYVAELNGIVNDAKPEGIILIPFDHDTYEHREFYQNEPVEYLYETGGGTNFDAAFAAAEEVYMPGDRVLMFTDMECSIPEAPSFADDMLWIAVNPHYYGGKPSYGAVIEVKSHQIGQR